MSQRARKFDDDYIGPMLELVQKSGMTLDDLRAYSEAMHAPSFNQMIRERRKDSDPLFAELEEWAGKGLSDADAEKTVNRYKTRDGFDYLEKAHGVLVGLNQAMLDRRVEAGLMKKAQADAL